jgi:hypothetical protein
MVSQHVFYQLVLLGLLWLFFMLHVLWPSDRPVPGQRSPQPMPPARKRSQEPKPFRGLTHKPHGDACEQTVALPREPPCPPPPRIVSTRGRQRHVDTSSPFCPDPDCHYGGWLGRGHISANGHPSGGS